MSFGREALVRLVYLGFATLYPGGYDPARGEQRPDRWGIAQKGIEWLMAKRLKN